MADFFDHELERILREAKQRSDAAERAKTGRTKLTFKEEFEAVREGTLAPALRSISDRLLARGIENAVVTEKQEGHGGTGEPFILLQITHDPIERFQRAQISTFPHVEFRCDSHRKRVVINRTTVGPSKSNQIVADGEAGLSDLNDEFVQKKVLALIQDVSLRF